MDIRSHLVFEIGTLNTRVGYFEEVGAHLRLIHSVVEPSTHMAPEHNGMLGVQKAIRLLEKKIDKQLLVEGRLICPEDGFGSGVDNCEGSYSFGSAISTLVIDLARKDNTENIREIAARNNMRISDGVNDKDVHDPAFMLNVLDESAIELILLWVDGSSDQRRIEQVIELSLIAKDVYGPEKQPFILMIGDPRKIRQSNNLFPLEFERLTLSVPLDGSPRDRHSIDRAISTITERQVQRAIPSMVDIKEWVGKNIVYSDRCVEEFVPLTAKHLHDETNVLHIDIGASSILLTGRVNGAIVREKYDQLGVGAQFAKALSVVKIPALLKRGAFPSEDKVRNYIFARSLHPEYIPDRADELAIHYEVTRAMLSFAFEKYYIKNFPARARDRRELAIDRIYVSGEVFTNAPHFHHLARLLLEGIKLPSSATIYLDRYNIVSMIGRITEDMQDRFERLELNSCVTPIFFAFPVRSTELEGSPVLKVRVSREDNPDEVIDVLKGDVVRVDLKGATMVSFYPVGHTDVGFGSGISREEKFSSEIKTLLIDARERPIDLPSNFDERKNTITRWQIALGEVL